MVFEAKFTYQLLQEDCYSHLKNPMPTQQDHQFLQAKKK